jgi:hypothetical protein
VQKRISQFRQERNWARHRDVASHKWKVVTEKKFDVKRGKLVTLLRCERCGEEQAKLL